MSKIVRNKLARGTKLSDEHLFRPLRDMAKALSASIDTDNLKPPMASFRLNFCIPEFAGALNGTITATSSSFPELMIPFVLPPLQEFFDTRGVLSSSTPTIILDEFGLSFDQRDESAIIRSSDKPTVDGYLDYDEVANDRYDLNIRLAEKNMSIFDSAQTVFVPTQEIFSTELKTTSFIDKNFRLNPFVINNLNKQINPYKSYTLFLKAPNLTKNLGNKFAFVSLNISMKFKHPLVERDIWSATKLIQNIPTKHSGSHSGEVVTITGPSSGSLILADGAAGINTNLGLIDSIFSDKLRAGYSEDGEVYINEHIKTDAAYEVITVPIFAGLSHSIDLINGNFNRLPYVGASPFTGSTCDRRIIPIVNPMTIHHVIAARNWGTTPDQRNMHATASAFSTEISVGMGTGLWGDNFGYQEIAYATFNQNQTASFLIDKIKQKVDGQMTADAARPWDSELFHIPLVYFKNKDQTKHLGTSYPLTASLVGAAGGTGNGVYTGNPVYIGKTWLGLEARTEIATTASGSAGYSAVNGQEQFLEVRWKFGDTTNGLSSSAHGSYQNQNVIFKGYGPDWIYIIGKKHLTGLDDG